MKHNLSQKEFNNCIQIITQIMDQLKQEPCEDCISRRDALNAITMSTARWQAVEHIEELPPVLPQVERTWVPVSEGTPKENETVIASTKYGVYPEAKYTKEYGWEWAYESGSDYWVELKDVEAWMPLPKRYIKKEVEE